MKLLQLRKALREGKSIFDLPLRVAFYARVSTDTHEQLNSLDNQVTFYEDYIRQNPNWTFAGRYVDEGISGTSVTKRESFLRMLADARSGAFDLLITKEISRFSRNTLDSIRYTQELLQNGVGVYFQSDNINTLEPDSELRLTIMSSIAQDEVRKLSERLKFGYRRAVANGRVLGRDNLWGYDKKDGRLTVNESEAGIVRTVFARYVEGRCGLRRIARDLEKEGILDSNGKMFSYATLHGMLRNPKYKGWYVGHKSENPDYRSPQKVALRQDEWVMHPDPNVPVIVSEEVWEEANRLLAERGKRMRSSGQVCQSRYAYSGKLICAEHGTAYHRHVYKSKSGDKECWNCKMYRLKGKSEGCDGPTLYTAELNQIMSEVYDAAVANKDEIIENLVALYKSTSAEKDDREHIARLRDQVETVSRKKEKLLELYVENLLSKEEFQQRNNRYNEELEKTEKELNDLEACARARENVDAAAERWRNQLVDILSGEQPYNEELLSVILDRIYIHKTEDKNRVKLVIHLKFGGPVEARVKRKEKSITLWELGISQAQVSRLEKNAISQIKRYL